MAGCFCMGPLRDEPFCPCMMRAKGVRKKNGRWVIPPQDEIDLGPVIEDDTSPFRELRISSNGWRHCEDLDKDVENILRDNKWDLYEES